MQSVVMGRVGLLWLKSTLIELLGRNPTQRFIGTVKEPGIAILHHWCRTFAVTEFGEGTKRGIVIKPEG